MQIPLDIVIQDVERFKEYVEPLVIDLAGKLERRFPRVVGARVVVKQPHPRHETGSLYRTSVIVTVPGRQIVVNQEHPISETHENLLLAIRHAFDDAARQLEQYSHERYGDVKDHDLLPHGVVAKLFADEGYGFIETFGGREIYFHRNSVLDGFERLKVGMEVRFAEEMGHKGPQASTVKVLHREHVHHRRH
jgi:cold shock CspA family protein